MSTIRAMIDIETFGRPPRAVILEVGVDYIGTVEDAHSAIADAAAQAAYLNTLGLWTDHN